MAEVFTAAVYEHIIPKQDMIDVLELHAQPRGSTCAQPDGAEPSAAPFAQLVAVVWLDGNSTGEQQDPLSSAAAFFLRLPAFFGTYPLC